MLGNVVQWEHHTVCLVRMKALVCVRRWRKRERRAKAKDINGMVSKDTRDTIRRKKEIKKKAGKKKRGVL